MDAVKETRKRITLTVLFLGLPSVFLILGGVLLTSFNSAPLGVLALIAGFAMYILFSIRAAKINAQIAERGEVF